MKISDDDIIARLRKGERQLFGQLIERYRDRGFSLALRILRNRMEAEEALQDAFVRAYRGLGGFEGASGFGTWFYRILYNVCMSALSRKRKREEVVASADVAMPEAGEEPVREGDYSGLELRDLMAHVVEALDRLPEKYSSVLSMFYVQELSYPEISEVTGMPAGTVKTHLFRGRLLLQNELAKHLHNEEITI
jgi:RNA polymerase sigma-70 factor (ECF subfamily)